ncbi:hypothetical protein FUA48_02550 [Flavobacterium alkalisoli]|uniref:Uncharacterized protein n=1 Tax=Flavobacterium alkalisoli TaxID=2602769 RepID=A0A5B9FQS5_9FLAO|nr:hypothetical protein [Flavobacterium alkalisoli]QEE48491.1 hypothetical protein FUA48_02550 [Flavobacterium alkalisoli]
MKKTLMLALFSLFAITFSSCTGEDDGPSQGGIVKFKLDGTQKEHVICIVLETEVQPNEYILTLTSSNTEETGVFRYEIPPGVTGNVTPEFMAYQLTNKVMVANEGEYQTNVSVNSDGHLKGTFSGTFRSNLANDDEFITITEGEFDVHY